MITQKHINDLSYKIVGCAIEVHKELGPGLLENVYEKCMIEELLAQNLEVKEQVAVTIKYKGKQVDANLYIDLMVSELVIVELKAVEKLLPIYKAQLLTYLKLTGKPKGLLINFNSENITKELVPLVTENFANLPKE